MTNSPIPRSVSATSALLLTLLLAACSTSPQPRLTSEPAPIPEASTSPAEVVADAPRPPPAKSTPATPPFLPSTDGSLSQRIDAFLSQPRFRHASWGIDVVELDSGQIRYSHNPDKLFVPASNTKLYTAALALDTLGPNARFSTTLLTTAARRGSELAGDLILRGGGDPSLGNARVAPQSADWADIMAASVSALGITRIDGDLIGDDTHFHAPAFGTGWEADDLQASYAPAASALSTNGNLMAITVSRSGTRCCDIKVAPKLLQSDVVNLTKKDNSEADRSITIFRKPGDHTFSVTGNLTSRRSARRYALAAPDPARLAVLQLRQALLHHGVTVRGRVRVAHWPEPAPVSKGQRVTVVQRIMSPPVHELIRHMLKRSDNLFAQILLLDVGEHLARSGTCTDRLRRPTTSEQWGRCAMRAMLRRAGIDQAEATFSEGSGLSRRNLISPSATTSLLIWAHRQSFSHNFFNALPVAGVDGTLAHRMRGSTAENNIHAKTGTLTHAYALAGYATDAQGKPLAFALSLDRYQRPRDAMGRRLPPSPSRELDSIAMMIADDGAVPPAHDEPTATGIEPFIAR